VPQEPSLSDAESSLADPDTLIPLGILKFYNGDDSSETEDFVADTLLYYPEKEVTLLRTDGRIVTLTRWNKNCPGWMFIRVYACTLVRPPSPFKRRGSLKRASKEAVKEAWKTVISRLDTSPEAWNGDFDLAEPITESGDESLFYIFNTLQSPDPNPDEVSDPFAVWAMDALMWNALDPSSQSKGQKAGISGLKTPLYAYQRRSAAFMVQKESEPGDSLDPRLQCFEGPTGEQFYYDREEGSIIREKRMYSNARGGEQCPADAVLSKVGANPSNLGILAETMGYGKTLICLAVILATRGYFPQIPPEHLEGLHPIRPQTGSFLEMAAATAGRLSIPWKWYFEYSGLSGLQGECLRACERNRGQYAVSKAPRFDRGTKNSMTISTRIRLCSGTVVIVPPNLVDHWLQEIDKHTTGLNLLVLRDSRDQIPSADDLLKYDVVLMSRPRFDYEARDFISDKEYPRVPYVSPLVELHWLRVIVDEGHYFANNGRKSIAAHFLDKLHVERRWVVSGTPASGLYGVEVSLASQETPAGESPEDESAAVLQARKQAKDQLTEELNVKKLRGIIVDFLKLKPWSNSRASDPAKWEKYVKLVGTDGQRRLSPSLRATLQSIFVRHRAEYINRELTLPKLYNRVVRLDPTYYDRLSLNLFLFHLNINAITSERTDQDYMFHPTNRKHLRILIDNMRHAHFWWTGIKSEDVQNSVKIAKRYLEKNMQHLPTSDLELLRSTIEAGESALGSPSWRAFSGYEDLGVFVQGFPEHARSIWSIDDLKEHEEPLLLSTLQAKRAQQFVTSRLSNENPLDGIAGAGIRAKRELRERVHDLGRPVERRSIGDTTPKNQTSQPTAVDKTDQTLPPDSPLLEAKIVATTSAKLTYLLDRVLEFHETEKIIIFYELGDIAYWIAEGLEMLGMRFRIYANTLKPEMKSKYLKEFNETDTVQVLLMDLRQAAHGLHVASASRIYIVNPIWDPNVESQAIKRAHRISQTRAVHVETLVLKDTLEDKMLKRRKEMSSDELQHAERDLLDDKTMSYIIQTERLLPLTEDETSASPAYLKDPPGFFQRRKLIPSDIDLKANTDAGSGSEADIDSSPSPIGVRFTRPSFTPSRTHSAPTTPSPIPRKQSKRKTRDDMPWIGSDVDLSSPFNTPPKKRRLSSTSETITESGIVMESPRSRTPVPRNKNSTSTT
jgi:hypothetical protein